MAARGGADGALTIDVDCDDGIEALLYGCPFELDPLLSCARFRKVRNLQPALQGDVDLVRDITLDRDFVLKTISRDLVAKKMSRNGNYVAENVISEISISAQLELEQSVGRREMGLTRFFGWWVDKSSIYIVSEYNAGGELLEYVKATAPRTTTIAWNREVQQKFGTLVTAVDFMHRNCVAHLDISVENVMLAGIKGDESTQLKIIDFGLARHFPDGNFRSHLGCGKTSCMPPEMYLGVDYDARSADIWCMGVLLFNMLFCTRPWPKAVDTNPAFNYVVGGHLEYVLRKWKIISRVTDDALDLLSKMLKYEKDRITMDELLKHPFVAIEDSSKKAKKSDSTLIATAAAGECSIAVTTAMPRLTTPSPPASDEHCAKHLDSAE